MDATFEHGQATLRVRRPTVRDNMTIQAVNWTLAERYGKNAPPAVLDTFIDQQFARFVVLTEVTAGALGWTWPLPTAPLEELLAALDAWSEQPEDFLIQWRDALARVTNPPNDPDLQPDADADPKGAATAESPKSAKNKPSDSTTG